MTALLLSPAARAGKPAQEGSRPGPRKGERFAPVELLAPNHGERLLFRPYDEQGRLRPTARRQLTHLLRCPHTGRERPVDGRLVPVLYQTGKHFRRRLVITSGYRPPQLTTVPRSRHLKAAAVDFQVPGVKNEAVVSWLRQQFHPVGVGYYPGGAHVHVDVDRQRDAFWVQRGPDRLPLHLRLLAFNRPRPAAAPTPPTRPPSRR